MTRAMTEAIVHITGARPNFPKLAPVVHALETKGAKQVIVHTGQHYDDKMSEVFFRDLELPRPDINLGVGSGSHAVQTAALLVALEKTLLDLRPSIVVVYGDINSTLAASLVASKLHTPVAHVEAGLRSFDMSMPEEINRLVTDRLSNILFATSADAVDHLTNEGVPRDSIHFVGNPMIDTLMRLRDRFDNVALRTRFDLEGDYTVATVHRPSNVDNDEVVKTLISSLHDIADQAPLVLPLHPRGAHILKKHGLESHNRVIVTEPLGYLDFMSLVTGASCIVTDSGGVQEETTVLGVPCLTVRPNTERPVTISHGTNKLSTWDTVAADVRFTLSTGRPASWTVPQLWDGHAGERIASVLINQ